MNSRFLRNKAAQLAALNAFQPLLMLGVFTQRAGHQHPVYEGTDVFCVLQKVANTYRHKKSAPARALETTHKLKAS